MNDNDIEPSSSESEEDDIKISNIVDNGSDMNNKNLALSNDSTGNSDGTKVIKATTATGIKASIVDGLYCCLYEGCNKKFKNASKFNRHGKDKKEKKKFFY